MFPYEAADVKIAAKAQMLMVQYAPLMHPQLMIHDVEPVLVMDSKKSNKSRSNVEVSRHIQTFLSSPPPASESRPSLKDRVRSAPLVAQSSSHHQSRVPNAHLDPSSKDDPKTAWLRTTQEEVGPPSPVAASSDQNEGARHMQEITLAVLGDIGVGKSTFIQCALDLKNNATSLSSIKKVSLDRVVSVLRLVEFRLQDLQFSEDCSVCWPTIIGNQSIPRIDGTLVLCDVMEKSSMFNIDRILNAFTKAAMPTVIVFTKCDNPRPSWQINQGMMESLCATFDYIESFEASIDSPETHKRCISIMMRNVMSELNKTLNIDCSFQPRALTGVQTSNVSQTLQSSTGKSKHSRAASELSSSQLRTTKAEHSKSKSSNSSILNSYTEQSSGDFKLSRNLSASDTSIDMKFQLAMRSKDNTADGVMLSISNFETKCCVKPSVPAISTSVSVSADPDTSKDSASSLLEMFSDYDDEQNLVPISPKSANEVNEKLSDSKDSGVSFNQLVDRLLSPPMSKSDRKFISIFLCLYRKIATPSDLMSAIVLRFKQMNDSDGPQIVRITSQLRYLSILAQWVSDYPGDFAHQTTRSNILSFVNGLGNNRIFAVASKEMNAQLDTVVEDDDTEWACSDTKGNRASTVESRLAFSSPSSANPALNVNSSPEDIGDPWFDESLKHRSTRNSATLSINSSSGRSGSQSTGSLQTLLDSVENAQRQAQLLTPIPRDALTKVQWHQLIDTPEEDIARELTRIDWIMFSSIRPRDFVRHVSLTTDQKERCKSLENVNRMICHFNHVAFWVANLVLLRDKPKHRAKALEKFMAVAWKLRYLNNYNSLGAVIAGINGTAVHRLSQTRDLIPLQSKKQFMRLEILMGTQKSHFAYRLAWANTSSERIPFLPLHRRDLVFAEEGNQTYVGGDINYINWKKFELMGEVIVGIQKSQSTPYPHISRNEAVQRLILDGSFSKDDDELYDRSIQIEGPGVGENVRRKFHWFLR